MAATIKDIAKLAGVSITTVSRALNNHSDVKRDTYKKISKIARQLGYQPNSSARSLVLKKTNTIGLIVSNLTTRSGHHFLFDVICGVNEQAALRNYDVFLFGTSTGQQNELRYEELCRKRRFDGVILAGLKIDDPYIEQTMNTDVPTVLLDIPAAADSVGSVINDDVGGSMTAIQHLIDYGHRHILFINGHREAVVSQLRLEGYKKALEKNGLHYDEENVAHADFEIAGGGEAFEALIARRPKATAVYCASDLMAYGMITKASELGYKVPDDISVVGFDGIEITEMMRPSLTTIELDRFQIGTSAVNMVLEMLEGTSGYTRMMSSKLIVRESTRKL